MCYYCRRRQFFQQHRPFIDDSQFQAQAQLQDQDQNQKTIFKDIGNVNIEIDNQNIAVSVLAILAFLAGTLDGAGVQSLLNRYLANNNTAQ